MPIKLNGEAVLGVTYDAETVDEALLNDILVFTQASGVISSIEVTRPPTKTVYYESETTVDVSGVEVTAIYTNGQRRVLDSGEYSYFPILFPGQTDIEFTYVRTTPAPIRILSAQTPITVLAVWNKYTVVGSGFVKQLYMPDVTHEYGSAYASEKGTALTSEPTFNPSAQSNPGFDFSNGEFTTISFTYTDTNGYKYWAAGADGLIERAASADDIDTNPYFYAYVTACTRATLNSFNVTADVYHLVQAGGTPTKGEFIETVEAPVGTYPDNGEYNGFWYEKTVPNS